MESKRQLNTPAVDLMIPSDHFESTSRLCGRLHRWRLLLGKYWWVLALIVLAMVGPALYLTVNSRPVYQSKARLWLPGKLDIRETRLYTEELLDYLSTQAELLRSRAVQERALARMGPMAADPARRKGSRPSPIAAIKNFFKSSPSGGEGQVPIPFEVEVEEARKSSMLVVWATGTDPKATRMFLNNLVEEYLRFKSESRDKTSERTMTSVAAEVKQLQKELGQQQEKLHAFQSSNNVVFLQEQGNSAASYLALLNKRIAHLQTELRLLQSLRPEQWVESKASKGSLPATDSVTDETTAKEMLASLAGPQAELFKANQQVELLTAKRDDLARFLRPLHPKIIKLNEDIDIQKRIVQIAGNEAAKQMSHRREAIELELQNLEKAFAEWDTRAIEASRKMADYDRLRQELQRLQNAYDKMLTLIQTVGVSKTVEQENVAILEPASVATPVNRMLRNVGIALIGSLFTGFGLLYCFGVFRDDFASLTELGQHLSEAVVGQVPAISLKKHKGAPALEAFEKQRFEFLESFRNIRSSLMFMNHGGSKPKTILIGSSVPEEGKSTVALYLAATMAMGNARVLLVDADMRRGKLHSFFGVNATPGLAEVLERETSPESAIVRTALDKLALMPAGEAKRNPGELVLSPEWDRLLSEVKEKFDYILVDTPPVLATNDAGVLAHKVDGVLFVVRGSFTSARLARGGLDALRQRQINVLGLILNRAHSSAYEYHTYQRYQDSYGWVPGKKERSRSWRLSRLKEETARNGQCH